MSKFYAVTEYQLKSWRKHLQKFMNETEIAHSSATYVTVEVVEHRMERVLNGTEPLDMHLCGQSKEDLVKELGIDWHIDYALPIYWVCYVRKVTGVDPVPHFVWSYKDTSVIGGKPLPITDIGEIILSIYNHIIGAK